MNGYPDGVSNYTELVASTQTDTGAAVIAGTAIARPVVLGAEDSEADRVFVVPDGHRVERVDPHDNTDTPARFRQRHFHVDDADSFLKVVERYHTADPAVFVNTAKYQVVGVLNDDAVTEDVPGWGDRLVTLHLTHTPEWNDWAGHNDRLMSQVEFVEFVEDHMSQIATPAAADLYEIAQSLNATTTATFRSAVRTSSGTRQFTYNENVIANAGQSGEIEIPETFDLVLSPWAGSDPVHVTARLKYRTRDEGLMLGYRMIAVREILDEAFDTLVRPIRDTLEFVVDGTP